MVGLARAYEALYIIRPDVEEEDYDNVIQRFEQLVHDNGGTGVTIDEWGVRPFAFEIEHYERGYYVLMSFEGPHAIVPELYERLKLDGRVLRQQIVRSDEDEDETDGSSEPETEEAAAETSEAETTA